MLVAHERAHLVNGLGPGDPGDQFEGEGADAVSGDVPRDLGRVERAAQPDQDVSGPEPVEVEALGGDGRERFRA